MRGVPISAALAVAAALTPTRTTAAPARWVELVSAQPVGETIERLSWSAGGYGVTVAGAIDYREILGKTKAAIRPNVVLELSRRAWAALVAGLEPAALAEFPFRVQVREHEDGSTVVTYRLPSSAFEGYDGEALRELGLKLDSKLEAIVRAATR